MNGLPIDYIISIFVLHYFYQLDLCSHEIILIFSMSNENIIIETRITFLYVSNQTKLVINSNFNINKSNEQAHLIFNPVWSNEGSGEPVKMSLDTSEHLQLVYTKYVR